MVGSYSLVSGVPNTAVYCLHLHLQLCCGHNAHRVTWLDADVSGLHSLARGWGYLSLRLRRDTRRAEPAAAPNDINAHLRDVHGICGAAAARGRSSVHSYVHAHAYG